MRKFKQYFGFFVAGALIVIAILVWSAVFARAQSGLLEVHFFDIGQGKSIFIETPDGNQILIDGGPNNSVIEKLSAVMPFFDREIDLVILTHPDSDHLNGLIDVLERYKVDRVMEVGISDSSAEYQVWHQLIKDKNIPIIYALAGQNLKIGEDFVLEILYPNRSLIGQASSNTNSSSIVARLIYGKSSFLFTGDAEAAIEAYLVGSGANVDSDILDVGHHGSKNSTGQDFLTAVSPEAAVIQVGAKNRYGHPAQEILDRLAGVKIYRTDICGDINVYSNGQDYNIQNNCP